MTPADTVKGVSEVAPDRHSAPCHCDDPKSTLIWVA